MLNGFAIGSAVTDQSGDGSSRLFNGHVVDHNVGTTTQTLKNLLNSYWFSKQLLLICTLNGLVTLPTNWI